MDSLVLVLLSAEHFLVACGELACFQLLHHTQRWLNTLNVFFCLNYGWDYHGGMVGGEGFEVDDVAAYSSRAWACRPRRSLPGLGPCAALSRREEPP